MYELNKVDLLKDVFIWAYEKSAERYAAVRQSLGEPDPFRQQHRQALRQLERDVVRGRLDRKEAAAFIGDWVMPLRFEAQASPLRCQFGQGVSGRKP